MLREKKLIILSHCILNQNSVVFPLARAKGSFSFAADLIKSGIGLIQLPCPEFRYLGITRKPMSKKEYDNPEYRKLCRELIDPTLADIKAYIENGYSIKGIIGIQASPTCSISGSRGILMEEFLAMLEESNIVVPYVEVPSDYEDEGDISFIYEKINRMIK